MIMRFGVVRNIPRVTFLFVLAIFPSLAPAVDVPKWSTYEISLTSDNYYANAYKDGSLTATFTGPGGVTKTVTGFWDGGNSFKVRFTPTVEGSWSYTTSSSDQGLNGNSGSFVAAALIAGRHGFLRIDPNYTNSFIWDDGVRYFMMGQTYYDWMQAANVNNNWKTSVDRMMAYGFSKVRFDVYACNVPSEHNDYHDAQPYTSSSNSPNRDSLNLAYWRKLDEMIQYMASKGLVADLIVTNPYRDNRQYGTDTQNDRFVNYVMARYAAYPNVIWCMCNEWAKASTGTYPQDQADFNRMGGLVRDGDPWRAEGKSLRPLTIHNTSRSITFRFFNADWPTYVANQYHYGSAFGYTKYGDVWGNDGITANLGHNMPVANDEYAYVGHKYSYNGQEVVFTQTLVRNAIWGIAAAGGYGSTADMREHPNGMGIPESTGDWQYQPEYDDIKHLVDFFTTKGIEYWKMTGHNELKTAGTRTYVLAEPGRQYVAYAATGGTLSLNLASGTYYAYQYDPRTGQTTTLATVTGGTTRSFSMPDSGNDWVLHLSTF
jgi:hypothetical protein